MTRLALLALALYGCSGCHPVVPPPVPPAPPVASCQTACSHGAELGCEWAMPTAKGASCEQVCAGAETWDAWAVPCLTAAASCAEADQCGQ
jgi:hypothetical protein